MARESVVRLLELISVLEFAGAIGISERSVQKKIASGQVQAVVENGRGRGGKVYKVPMTELPEKARIKYYAKKRNSVDSLQNSNHSPLQLLDNDACVCGRNDTGVVPYGGEGLNAECRMQNAVDSGDVGRFFGKPQNDTLDGVCSFALMCKEEISFDMVSAEQREKALWLKEMLFTWQRWRSEYKGDLASADHAFLKRVKMQFNMSFSIDKLYRLWGAYKKSGEIGLVDFRGKKNKGKTIIDKDVWANFEYLYLNQNKPEASLCYENIKIWAMVHRPNLLIPSYSTFTRMIKQIPSPVLELFRNGNKSYTDKCEMFMERSLKDLHSNDIWVADNHTIDVILRPDGTDLRHRLYLTAFIDARSRLLVGWNVTDRPNSDSTLLALRNGILAYGKPKQIYVDNGREFLTHDIGGKGHRSKKKELAKLEKIPPTILQLLEIKMTNALPRNARAKVIERWFREFTANFAKLFDTYTGSNPSLRPEYTKKTVKNEGITTDSELIGFLEKFITGFLNHRVQNGVGMNGKSPLEVYHANLVQKITVAPEKLNLLLMRTARPQTVRQNGVYLNLFNEKIWFTNEAFWTKHVNKTRVYVRYDPKDLATVRVYDMDDCFLAELPQNQNVNTTYNADNETIQKNMKAKRHFKKLVLAEYENRIYKGDDRKTAYEIVNMAIDMNMEKEYSNTAEIKEFEYEEKIYQDKVVGLDYEIEMLARMTENIKRNNS